MSRISNKEQMIKRYYRIFDILMPDLENNNDYETYKLFNPNAAAKIGEQISKLEGFYEAEKKMVDFGRYDPEMLEALELGKKILKSYHDSK